MIRTPKKCDSTKCTKMNQSLKDKLISPHKKAHIVLPSSLWWQDICQDAMGIFRWVGYVNLFITFTYDHKCPMTSQS